MRLVFADTFYWIAVTRPNDPWRQAGLQARNAVGAARLVTTDEVLTEFSNALSSRGERIRIFAAGAVRAILSNPNITVLPQTRDSFLSGLKLFEARADKGYSLTDCISMETMRRQSIHDVLTNDRHFEQEGFNCLVKRTEAP
jgi:predicted nucleic acid-binding protein